MSNAAIQTTIINHCDGTQVIRYWATDLPGVVLDGYPSDFGEIEFDLTINHTQHAGTFAVPFAISSEWARETLSGLYS